MTLAIIARPELFKARYFYAIPERRVRLYRGWVEYDNRCRLEVLAAPFTEAATEAAPQSSLELEIAADIAAWRQSFYATIPVSAPAEERLDYSAIRSEPELPIRQGFSYYISGHYRRSLLPARYRIAEEQSARFKNWESAKRRKRLETASVFVAARVTPEAATEERPNPADLPPLQGPEEIALVNRVVRAKLSGIVGGGLRRKQTDKNTKAVKMVWVAGGAIALPELTEEIVQQSWVRYWRRRPAIRNMADQIRVARQSCATAWRTIGRITKRMTAETQSAASAAMSGNTSRDTPHILGELGQREILEILLQFAKGREQAAIVLMIALGNKNPEIGRKMFLPLRTVERRLYEYRITTEERLGLPKRYTIADVASAIANPTT